MWHGHVVFPTQLSLLLIDSSAVQLVVKNLNYCLPRACTDNSASTLHYIIKNLNYAYLPRARPNTIIKRKQKSVFLPSQF